MAPPPVPAHPPAPLRLSAAAPRHPPGPTSPGAASRSRCRRTSTRSSADTPPYTRVAAICRGWHNQETGVSGLFETRLAAARHEGDPAADAVAAAFAHLPGGEGWRLLEAA